jgi:putative hydrolase of the HAD superfamily
MRPVGLDMVFLDIGGVMYRDEGYREALRRALREVGGRFTDETFDREYAAARRDQAGSFRTRLTRAILGPGGHVDEVERHAERWWRYAEDDLEPDVVPTLEELRGRYRLGIIANQPSVVREAMARDGLDRFFEVWAVSGDVGFEKPDPHLYEHAVDVAGVPAARAVMVGDRLDYDVRPARAAGMHTVWVLRGEAPPDPTPEQLAEPEFAIAGLAELPGVLERM